MHSSLFLNSAGSKMCIAASWFHTVIGMAMPQG